MQSINTTLKEREKVYGSFTNFANISQELKAKMWTGNWDSLSNSQQEALEMIQHKIARILNGDPNYSDNWHDIAGYATLIEMELDES